MQKDVTTQTLLACLVGILVGGFITHIMLDDRHDDHPIADPYDSQYHVHSDFHIIVNGELVDLSGNAFQTTAEQELHPDLHLHDNNGDVVHIHSEEKTFVEFLESLSITLTDSCITLDNEYCADQDGNALLLFVNDTPYTESFTEYIPVDDDRVLLYYGDPDPEIIQPLLETIPDDSCYYSGTCPERGIAPAESCGLTCEL